MTYADVLKNTTIYKHTLSLNGFQYLVPILLLLSLHQLNRTTISENPDMFATDISIADLNSMFSLNISLPFRTPRSNLAALQQPTVPFFRVSAVRCQIPFTVLREALCAQRRAQPPRLAVGWSALLDAFFFATL